jgi:protein tyrosine phosphatase
VRETTVVEDHGFTRRDLTLTEKRSGIERTIHHFTFTGWPEELAAPPSTDAFLQLQAGVASASVDDSGPMVIHCPSGSAASAVFAIVNVCLDKYVSTAAANVHREMINFRKCRPSAIISAEAYTFAHQVVVDGVLATPPNPNKGLAPAVAAFLKGIRIPEELAPFDVGTGGRLILRIDAVVW